MDDLEFEGAEPAETEGKKEVVRNIAKAGDTPLEDPSRATLHTGEDAKPDLGGETDSIAGHAVDATTKANAELPAEQNTDLAETEALQTLRTGDFVQVQVSPELEDRSVQSREEPSRSQETAASPLDVEPIPFARAEGVDSAAPHQTEQPSKVAIDTGPVNVAPTEIRLSGTEVSENEEGAVIGRLTVIDANNGDSHLFEVSDDRFEVVGGEVRLKPGIALDFEAAASIQFTVTATDRGGLSVRETFEITVSDMNEGPQSIALEATSIAENVEGAVVGRLSVTDFDAGDTHTITVSDDRFEVADGEVRLKPNVSLDHEAASTISLDVTATDSGGLAVTDSFEISIDDLNEAPDSISLDGGTVIGGEAGAVVGKLSVADQDAGDTHTFTVSDDRFEIVGGDVRLKPGIDLDAADTSSLQLEVTATDAEGLSKTETFEVSVFDPPVVSVETGFKADYFDVDGSLRRLDDIDWKTDPTHSEVTQNINYENGRGSFWEGGDTDTFGVRVKGNIDVSEGGTFKFFLGGDDGAMLYVNGEPVVDNDGLHGFRTRTGEIELPEGNHHIEVRYFENYGHAGLKLEWEGPGIEGRQLVEPGGDGAGVGVEGVAMPIDIDVSNVNETAAVSLEGLPEGTVVQFGDTSMNAGEDGSIDLTGVDLAGLSLTPPVGSAGTFSPKLTIVQAGPDGEAISVSHPIEIDVTPAHVVAPEVNLFSGFEASYFDVDHSLSRLDQIDWESDPTHQELVTDINYKNSSDSFWESGSRDTFGAKINGEIEVTEGGTYTFFLGGDDGAMLYINGAPVIDNDGLHGFRTRKGEIALEPGDYSVEVRYFENYGHAGLKLEWDGPGTDGKELVPAKPDFDIDQNATSKLSVDFGSTETVESVFLTGLPTDTVVFVDDATFVSDGGSIDLSGYDLSTIEIAPPSGFVGVVEGSVSTTSRAFNGQTTETSTPFEISVGVDEILNPSNTNDTSALMTDPSQEEPDFAAWTDSQETKDASEADGVMEEEIAEYAQSESPQEQLDTYERYDW